MSISVEVFVLQDEGTFIVWKEGERVMGLDLVSLVIFSQIPVEARSFSSFPGLFITIDLMHNDITRLERQYEGCSHAQIQDGSQ